MINENKKLIIALAITLVLIFVLILLARQTFAPIAPEVRSVSQTPRPRMFRPRPQQWVLADVPRVQEWFTFDFINFAFKLPPNYLSDKLPAPDKRYPNLSLESYANRHNLDHQKFLNDIRGNITVYLNQASSTATSTPATSDEQATSTQI